MGRFSPTVTPTWGESIGNALQGSVQSYLQTRRQRMEDELNLYGHGLQRVQPGDPNAPAPTPVAPSTPPAPSQPAGGGVTPQAIATALPQGPQPNFKGRPSPGQGIDPSLVAEALQRHVQSGQPLTSPNAAPAAPTPAPQQIGAALSSHPTHLMGWDVEMTPQARAQMEIAYALKNAEIGKANSETHKNYREADQLRLGDSGYAGAMGGVAGAQATAQVAPHVEEARQKAPIAIAQAGGVARAELPAKLAAQGNEADLRLRNDRETIPLHAKATVDEFRARQEFAPLDKDESTVVQHLPVVARAYQTLQQLAPGGPSAITDAIRKAGGVANYLNTPQGIQLNRAIKQLTLSGAVASEGPRGLSKAAQEAFEQAYAPRGWDNPQTMQHLFEDVQGMMRAGKVRVGRGWNRMDQRDRDVIDSALGGGTGAANPFESLVPKGKTP